MTTFGTYFFKTFFNRFVVTNQVFLKLWENPH